MIRLHLPQAARVGAVLLALGLGVYFYSFHDVDLNLADEGLLLTQALAVEKEPVRAESLDRMLERPIGILEHVALRLTGRSDVAAVRLLWTLLRVLLALCVLSVGRRILPWPLAALGAVLAAVACGPWYKTWYPFAVGVMLWLGARHLAAPRRASLLAAGIGGGALLCLFPAGIGLGATLPTLGLLAASPAGGRRARAALLLGGAGLLGVLLFGMAMAALVVASRGAAPSLILRGPLAALALLRGALPMVGFAARWASAGHVRWSALFETHDDFLNGTALGAAPGIWFLLQPLCLAGAVWLAYRRRAQGEAWLLWLIITLAAANFIKTCARADLSHVTQGSGPAYLLALYLLYRAASALRARASGGARLAGALGLAALAALFPVGYAAAVLRSPAQWAASVGSLRWAERALALPRARLRVPARQGKTIEATVERIRAWTTPDDRIFALPFCPAFYFLCERRPVPENLLYMVPGMDVRPDAVKDQHAAQALAALPVKLVVFCPGVYRLQHPERFFPRTMALLDERYERAFETEGVAILRLKSRGPMMRAPGASP